MRKLVVLSAALAPMVLGLVAALDRRPYRGLAWLVISVAVVELMICLHLYYVWLAMSD
jgi:hypothetical protein